MSTRILLSDERADEHYWDAQLVDYKDFSALADDNSILWGDHIHIYADEPYLSREKEFMDILEERRWPGVAAWCGALGQGPKDPARWALVNAFIDANKGPVFQTDHPCLSRGFHNSIDPGVCKDCGIECQPIVCPRCHKKQIVYEDGALSQPPLGQCWLCHNYYSINPLTNETAKRHTEREAVLCTTPRPPEG